MVSDHHRFIARRVGESVELLRDFEGMYRALDDPHGQAISADNLAHSVYCHLLYQLAGAAESGPVAPRRYLDVGSGLGFATVRIAEMLRSGGRDVEARGIDVSAEAAARASKKFGARVRFEAGSLLDDGLRARLGVFDVVTCFETLYYFKDVEIRDVADRLGSLVRPSGLLAITYHLPEQMGYGTYVRSLADLRGLLPGFDPLWEMDFVDSVSTIYDGTPFGRHLFSLLRLPADGR